MKKLIFILFIAVSNIVYGQTSNVYSSARFLRFDGFTTIHNDYRKPFEVPNLSYSFTLTKNTIIQIANIAAVKTHSCILCPETEVYMDVWVDNVVFTSCQFKGDNKIHTLTNFALAQLNPGTHTIKVVLYKNLDSADFDLQGYNINAGNRTTLSLVFFEQ